MQVDHERNEPFLPIEGFEELRLSPLRLRDSDDIVRLFNDPDIGKYFYKRPYPFVLLIRIVTGAEKQVHQNTC